MEISAGIVFAIVLAAFGSVTSAVTAVLTYLRMRDLEHSTNSQFDKILKLTAKASKREGKEEGKREAEDEADGK